MSIKNELHEALWHLDKEARDRLIEAFAKEVREAAIKEMSELVAAMPVTPKVESGGLWHKLGWKQGRDDAAKFILNGGLDGRQG